MAGCDPLVFSGVDEAKLASIKESLSASYGVNVDADQGEQTVKGFTFEWSYAADQQLLRIQCTGKPMLIPCSVITGRISDLAEKSGVSRT
jgi:hypothetical protein